MSEEKRPSRIKKVILLIVVLGALAAVAAFAPVVPCPDCGGTGKSLVNVVGSRELEKHERGCATCGDAGRVPLLKKLRP